MSKNKILKIVIIIFIILVFVGIIILINSKNEVNSDDENSIATNTSTSNNFDSINNYTENILTEEEDMNNEEIGINIIVNDKIFTATLYNNETVKELITHFPMELNMIELHSNEKYNYLNFTLTTNSYTPSKINAGDIKLYGNDCLVVFYQSFSNSYSYTDLGRIDDVENFVSELGNGNIILKFEIR